MSDRGIFWLRIGMAALRWAVLATAVALVSVQSSVEVAPW